MSEGRLVFILGPPTDAKLKGLFDDFQKAKRDGTSPEGEDWKCFEEKVAKELFTREECGENHIEWLLGALLKEPIRIEDYFLGIGFHRKLWVATITIRARDTRRRPGSNLTWPPPQEIRDEVAAGLLQMLDRAWLG